MAKHKRLCPSVSSFFGCPEDTFAFERALIRAGHARVAGVDEAGRGPLAGPVVAGCVVLPEDCEFHRFKDSKQLAGADREALFDLLHACGAGIGYAVVSNEEIDRINILQASLQAMAGAMMDLSGRTGIKPDFLLVDGTITVPVDLPQQTLIKGESKSASIAAASIIAKVIRDRLMVDYHRRFPEYNFQHNKGYPTEEHRRRIELHGPCPIHRRTFKGVREYLEQRMEKGRPRQTGLW
ncbi:MAG TPA: ribonuclease HII [Desulfobacteraceae bacterium]|nr:ribonuclease HII [Desulfobacteraceae bacterium]